MTQPVQSPGEMAAGETGKILEEAGKEVRIRQLEGENKRLREVLEALLSGAKNTERRIV